jgi:16S rRNA (cytosine1407-C5)-methyltransferase
MGVSSPQDVLEQYRGALEPDALARLLQAIQRPLPPALRVNTLKISVDEARSRWPAQYGWEIQAIPFCDSGWQINNFQQSLGKTLEHKMGYYYVQDAASMLPVELFQPQPPPALVLDMAASPGGKTTHLVCKLQDRGLLIANDSRAGRLAALRLNLERWGAASTVVANYPGQRFGDWFPGTFDQVLLDAPCSGEGLRTAERRKSQPVPARRRAALQRQQIRLLTSAFQAAKPGGQIVYSTCSLHPDENEAVLDALLNAYPEQAAIESVERLASAPALVLYQGREFHPDVRRALRLWPHVYDTAGFFAALLRKQGPSAPAAPSPQRPTTSARFRPLGRRERAAVLDRLLQDFGFDLGTILQEQELALVQRGESVYAAPELFLSRFAGWPCVAMGLPVGEQSKGDFMPAHELVSRFSAQFTQRRLRLAGEQARVWLAGRDLRGLDAAPYPTRALVLLEDEQGRFLGLGKVLQRRVRNLLPRNLIY